MRKLHIGEAAGRRYKIAERVQEKKLRDIVEAADMQFVLRKGRGTTDALFVLWQKRARNGGELYVAFVDLKDHSTVYHVVAKLGIKVARSVPELGDENV